MKTSNWHQQVNIVRKKAKRFNKIVVWGLRSFNGDSFRYIMDHFYTTLGKLNVPSVWVDDAKDNHQLVQKGDLVIAANVTGHNLPIKKGVYYCLHNFDKTVYQNADQKKTLVLQVYTNDAEKGTTKWDAVTRFDKKNRTLYQPWGTNLLPWEFMSPVFPRHSRFVFWVGTIYSQGDRQGNYSNIQELRNSLDKYGIQVVHLRVPDPIHVQLIRWSRIAPAIAGQWQSEVNYLPCRMFKNISYGQLGITNVLRFKDLLGNSFLAGGNIADLVERSLLFSQIEYKSLVLAQQEVIRNQTYLHKLLNIFTALEEIA